MDSTDLRQQLVDRIVGICGPLHYPTPTQVAEAVVDQMHLADVLLPFTTVDYNGNVYRIVHGNVSTDSTTSVVLMPTGKATG